jgi:deoxyribodipyrimidine photo-lyase
MPRAGRAYQAHRNEDLGPEDRSNVSALSPYLRRRLVLESELAHAAVEQHGNAASEKFVQEVVWRGYFKGWMERHPEVWARFIERLDADRALAAATPALEDALERARTGGTGIDCFDAWSRELVETGYLHNHARMWFASIWIFTLRLPWTLGAAFFLEHLLDGDPASNTLGWRWVAGLHTRGKHYLARASNIAKYTHGRFNPEGRLDEAASPLVEDLELPETHPGPTGDPLPRGRVGLLITIEDLHTESLALKGTDIVSIAALDPETVPHPHPRSDTLRRFDRAAVEDGMSRAAEAYALHQQAVTVPATMVPATPDAFERWVADKALDAIVTPWTPVGPTNSALALITETLHRTCPVHRVLRPWDAAIWPHADRGFFKVKKQIPRILEATGDAPQGRLFEYP